MINKILEQDYLPSGGYFRVWKGMFEQEFENLYVPSLALCLRHQRPGGH